jgi:PAS domain S-box-containing protein
MSNKKSTSDDKSITFTAFDDIVKKSEDFIFIKDAHSIYLGCSDTFAKLTGRDSSADVIGKTDFDLFPRDIAEKYVKDDIEVFKIKKPLFNLVEKIPGPNGTTGWTKTSKTPVFDKEGKLVGIYGVSRDITRVVSLEGELQTAQKYSDLVSHFPGGVSIFHEKDGAFFLDFANDSFFQLHGVDSKNGKQWIGQNISSVLEAEDLKRIINEFGKIASDKKGTATSTYRFKGEDGQIHWIMIASHYAYTQQGIDYYYASYANIDNQKEVEKKLVDSQDTLRDAINNSNIQYFTYYPNKHLVEINTLNNSYCNLPLQWNNYPDDFLAFVKASPSDADIYRQMVKKIDEGEKEAGCTIQMFYRGVFLWQKVKITAIKDNFGNTVKALGYSLDVTDRKKAEQLIQKERMRFRAKEGNIFETFSFNLTKNSEPVIQTMDKEMIDAVITDDIYNEAVAISPNLANSTPAVRSIMLKVATLIPEHKDRELFINTFSGSAVRQAFSDGKYTVTAEYRRRRGDSIHWVSTTMEALPDPDTGDIIAFFATKDINEQVLKEKIIKCIYDFQYETVFLLDLNSKKVRLFSYRDKNEQSLDGLDYSECLKKVSERAEESNREQFLKQYDLADIQEHLKAGGVYTLYYERNQKAENLPGNVNKRMKSDIFFLDENKDVLVFLTTDVTSIFEQERENRERLSQALAAAEQASLAKTQFLSRMSHEIRTPMNAIIGLDSIALQEKDLSSAMEDHLQKIGISARFLLSLINDILDMSRIESGRMMLNIAPFNFEELINGINTILYQQCHECELDYECILKSYTEDTYVGDVTKLQQVLVNILGNAVKFTPKGGKVTFSIEQVSQTKEKAKMRFEIADTGIGIDEKFIPQLFQPFSQENRGKTSAYGGTGLGLAISKNIVNLMNGEITVHSIKNVGSEFTVEIELGLSEKSIQRIK